MNDMMEGMDHGMMDFDDDDNNVSSSSSSSSS
jgi:hypothetical protein